MTFSRFESPPTTRIETEPGRRSGRKRVHGPPDHLGFFGGDDEAGDVYTSTYRESSMLAQQWDEHAPQAPQAYVPTPRPANPYITPAHGHGQPSQPFAARRSRSGPRNVAPQPQQAPHGRRASASRERSSSPYSHSHNPPLWAHPPSAAESKAMAAANRVRSTGSVGFGSYPSYPLHPSYPSYSYSAPTQQAPYSNNPLASSPRRRTDPRAGYDAHPASMRSSVDAHADAQAVAARNRMRNTQSTLHFEDPEEEDHSSRPISGHQYRQARDPWGMANREPEDIPPEHYFPDGTLSSSPTRRTSRAPSPAGSGCGSRNPSPFGRPAARRRSTEPFGSRQGSRAPSPAPSMGRTSPPRTANLPPMAGRSRSVDRGSNFGSAPPSPRVAPLHPPPCGQGSSGSSDFATQLANLLNNMGGIPQNGSVDVAQVLASALVMLGQQQNANASPKSPSHAGRPPPAKPPQSKVRSSSPASNGYQSPDENASEPSPGKPHHHLPPRPGRPSAFASLANTEDHVGEADDAQDLENLPRRRRRKDGRYSDRIIIGGGVASDDSSSMHDRQPTSDKASKVNDGFANVPLEQVLKKKTAQPKKTGKSQASSSSPPREERPRSRSPEEETRKYSRRGRKFEMSDDEEGPKEQNSTAAMIAKRFQERKAQLEEHHKNVTEHLRKLQEDMDDSEVMEKQDVEEDPKAPKSRLKSAKKNRLSPPRRRPPNKMQPNPDFFKADEVGDDRRIIIASFSDDATDSDRPSPRQRSPSPSTRMSLELDEKDRERPRPRQRSPSPTARTSEGSGSKKSKADRLKSGGSAGSTKTDSGKRVSPYQTKKNCVKDSGMVSPNANEGDIQRILDKYSESQEYRSRPTTVTKVPDSDSDDDLPDKRSVASSSDEKEPDTQCDMGHLSHRGPSKGAVAVKRPTAAPIPAFDSDSEEEEKIEPKDEKGKPKYAVPAFDSDEDEDDPFRGHMSRSSSVRETTSSSQDSKNLSKNGGSGATHTSSGSSIVVKVRRDSKPEVHTKRTLISLSGSQASLKSSVASENVVTRVSSSSSTSDSSNDDLAGTSLKRMRKRVESQGSASSISDIISNQNKQSSNGSQGGYAALSPEAIAAAKASKKASAPGVLSGSERSNPAIKASRAGVESFVGLGDFEMNDVGDDTDNDAKSDIFTSDEQDKGEVVQQAAKALPPQAMFTAPHRPSVQAAMNEATTSKYQPKPSIQRTESPDSMSGSDWSNPVSESPTPGQRAKSASRVPNKQEPAPAKTGASSDQPNVDLWTIFPEPGEAGAQPRISMDASMDAADNTLVSIQVREPRSPVQSSLGDMSHNTIGTPNVVTPRGGTGKRTRASPTDQSSLAISDVSESEGPSPMPQSRAKALGISSKTKNANEADVRDQTSSSSSSSSGSPSSRSSQSSRTSDSRSKSSWSTASKSMSESFTSSHRSYMDSPGPRDYRKKPSNSTKPSHSAKGGSKKGSGPSYKNVTSSDSKSSSTSRSTSRSPSSSATPSTTNSSRTSSRSRSTYTPSTASTYSSDVTPSANINNVLAKIREGNVGDKVGHVRSLLDAFDAL